jgi:hypothetical protein
MSITRVGTYSQIKGTSVKLPCRVATTADTTLNNTTTSIDGITLAANDRILVWKQATGANNGIYVYNTTGSWNLATDMSYSEDVLYGIQVYVNTGTTNGGKNYMLITPDPINLGTTTLSFQVRNAEVICVVASDEGTSLTTGTSKVTFRMPYAMTLYTGTAGVRSNVTTAPIGSAIIVDINLSGVSILSGKLTIDASTYTSVSSGSPVVISTLSLTDDTQMTIDIDQVGSSTPGTGLKIYLIGTRTS